MGAGRGRRGARGRRLKRRGKPHPPGEPPRSTTAPEKQPPQALGSWTAQPKALIGSRRRIVGKFFGAAFSPTAPFDGLPPAREQVERFERGQGIHRRRLNLLENGLLSRREHRANLADKKRKLLGRGLG